MTVADVVTHQDNPVFDCDGAQVRAQQRHLATVVHLRGEIGALNVDRIRAHIRRFTLGDGPVIVDLGDTNPFAGAGISLLSAFDGDCRAAGVEWTLVAAPAVAQAVGGSVLDELPVADSVPEALHARADAIARRRQLVTPLLTRPA